ncbi:MAG: hypothetical protein ACI9HB_003282 [Gammaproteobacteria bacterium]|jgi:hypothetical protein
MSEGLQSEPIASGHVRLAECEDALSTILAAPKSGAIVEQLCLRPGFSERSFPELLELTVAGGIIGERWTKAPWLTLSDGTPDPRIQVSILSKRVMDLCWRDRENTHHPGDTMIVDMDLGVENLPNGTRLGIGSAVVEVSDKFNTACIKWQGRYGAESLRWLNLRKNRDYRLRGILCRIVQDGVVRLGDELARV